jgi:hypothetical protein
MEFKGNYAYKNDQAENLTDVAIQNGYFELGADDLYHVGAVKYAAWIASEEIKKTEVKV